MKPRRVTYTPIVALIDADTMNRLRDRYVMPIVAAYEQHPATVDEFAKLGWTPEMLGWGRLIAALDGIDLELFDRSEVES